MWTKAVPAFLFVCLFGVSSCATLVLPPGQDSFQTGLKFFNRGNFGEAIPHFQEAIESDPNFAQAYFYLGRSLISMRRWQEGIPPLRTAYRLAPEAAKQEIFNVLLDAFFAVALNGYAPERIGTPVKGQP
jgi:tetratricopeptide (TPR) repeat protein